MQPMQHQVMGYDRTSTMFSPDGRLLQAEYAKKTVKQCPTSIGIACKDGIVVIADKRISDTLVLPSSVEKVFQIDDHIGAAVAGVLSDGRVLIEKARLFAQQYKITYNMPIDTTTLVKEICDIKQSFTQFGGARPFGVSLLFIGADDEKLSLFVTDPLGVFIEYKATAIGEAETEIKEMLNKQYTESLLVKDGVKMGINMLKKVLGKSFDLKRVDVAYVMMKEKRFTRVEGDDIKKYMK